MNDFLEDDEEVDPLEGAAYRIGAILIMIGVAGIFIWWLLR